MTNKRSKATTSRRKCRKAHFGSSSHIRRKMMSAPLSKELRQKHSIRAMPIRKDDEVTVVRGTNKGGAQGSKVIAVYRKRWVIHIDKIQRDRANGITAKVGIHPSNVIITKLKMTEDRKRIIERKSSAKKAGKEKGKISQKDVMDTS
ncbi:hypothetical protein LOD99_7108 [Oopsacas minuta]|uniref:Ribosomal protein L26 n=1 Tax=Oopsacas minuta TaxID=111878 RepID=A0AAV7JJJ6_9METZ|nr:hypothetical protein LOD99_7108 [Oopsacas minuta]